MKQPAKRSDNRGMFKVNSVDGPNEDLVKWVRNAGFAQAWEKVPDRARL